MEKIYKIEINKSYIFTTPSTYILIRRIAKKDRQELKRKMKEGVKRRGPGFHIYRIKTKEDSIEKEHKEL